MDQALSTQGIFRLARRADVLAGLVPNRHPRSRGKVYGPWTGSARRLHPRTRNRSGSSTTIAYSMHDGVSRGLCPTACAVPLIMTEPCAEIIECEHGVGEPHSIQADGPKRPWSWRAFVNAMKAEEAERVVGPGLVGLSLYPRPGSYDHRRAAVARKHGQDLSARDGRPPIRDFKFDRSHGSSVLAHPRSWCRWRSL